MRHAQNVHSEETRNVYRTLVVNRHEKTLHGIFKHRWTNNILIDLKEMECTGLNFIKLGKNRIQWWAFAVMMMMKKKKLCHNKTKVKFACVVL